MSWENIKSIRAVRYNDGTVTEIDDPVIVEDVVHLYLNGRKMQSIVASFTFPEELGAGFFIATGAAKEITSVTVQGNTIFVTGTEDSSFAIPKTVIDSPLTITPDEIFAIRNSLDREEWDLTGGLHCTALYHNHIIKLFTDIGRHNTVDKAIGYIALQHLNPAECVLGCTGRQPCGMVLKAANARIPIIISRAASTTTGIEAAEKNGITLLCFTRNKRFTIYTHPERIIL